MPNIILVEDQLWLYLTLIWEDKGVQTFPSSIFSESERNCGRGIRTI